MSSDLQKAGAAPLIARSLASTVSSCFGPHGNDKALVSSLGRTLITSSCYAILNSLQLSHPVATIFLDLIRLIHNQIGDGSCSFLLMISEALQQIESQSRRYKAAQLVRAIALLRCLWISNAALPLLLRLVF